MDERGSCHENLDPLIMIAPINELRYMEGLIAKTIFQYCAAAEHLHLILWLWWKYPSERAASSHVSGGLVIESFFSVQNIYLRMC
jgi:hypothetical protein